MVGRLAPVRAVGLFLHRPLPAADGGEWLQEELRSIELQGRAGAFFRKKKDVYAGRIEFQMPTDGERCDAASASARHDLVRGRDSEA